LIRLWPVPAVAGQPMYIEGVHSGQLLELCDTRGRVVERITLTTGERFTLPAGLQSGLYLVRTANGEQVWRLPILRACSGSLE